MSSVDVKIFELLSAQVKAVSDQKISDTFIGALRLTEDQKNVVDFVFWLCYMAETDLNDVLTKAWNQSASQFSSETQTEAFESFKKSLSGYRKDEREISLFLKDIQGINEVERRIIQEFIDQNYSQKRKFIGFNDLSFFTDKIKVYECLMGNNNVVGVLWKINGIRNDLSHNRLMDLSYNGESLFLRSTKEKIILDYFLAHLTVDTSRSPVWNSLTDDEKKEVEKMRNSMFNNHMKNQKVK